MVDRRAIVILSFWSILRLPVFFFLFFCLRGGGGGGADEIKTAFLMYALASFHVDCALVGCLAYGINVFATLFRQSDREISIVYGLAAKSAIHDAL